MGRLREWYRDKTLGRNIEVASDGGTKNNSMAGSAGGVNLIGGFRLDRRPKNKGVVKSAGGDDSSGEVGSDRGVDMARGFGLSGGVRSAWGFESPRKFGLDG